MSNQVNVYEIIDPYPPRKIQNRKVRRQNQLKNTTENLVSKIFLLSEQHNNSFETISNKCSTIHINE